MLSVVPGLMIVHIRTKGVRKRTVCGLQGKKKQSAVCSSGYAGVSFIQYGCNST